MGLTRRQRKYLLKQRKRRLKKIRSDANRLWYSIQGVRPGRDKAKEEFVAKVSEPGYKPTPAEQWVIRKLMDPTIHI